jgi:hypothetical protein
MQKQQVSWSLQQLLAAGSSAVLQALLTRHQVATGASSRHTQCGRYALCCMCCVARVNALVVGQLHVSNARLVLLVHAESGLQQL